MIWSMENVAYSMVAHEQTHEIKISSKTHVLDEILDLVESVSEDFPSYSYSVKLRQLFPCIGVFLFSKRILPQNLFIFIIVAVDP